MKWFSGKVTDKQKAKMAKMAISIGNGHLIHVIRNSAIFSMKAITPYKQVYMLSSNYIQKATKLY